jgi:uncharacterized membrane protein required for colicin V production
MEPHTGFNNLDYIVIGTVLLSGLLALMRGFMRELFSLIAWVGAYFAADKLYPLAVPLTRHYIKNDKAVEWAAMAGVFVITLIVLMIVGHFVCALIKGRALTTVDRSLGFLYGLARGVLVVSLVYLGVVMILWPDIDNPQEASKPVSEQQADQQAIQVADQQANQQPGNPDKAVSLKDRVTPPTFLLEAKTRPALSYASKLLTGLIPKDFMDAKLKSTEEHINDVEKAHILDKMSTPAPPGQGGGSIIDPSYKPTQGTKP